MKTAIYVVLLSFFVIAPKAQEKSLAYGAYLKFSKTLWRKSVEKASGQFGGNSMEKAIALYGLLNNTMADKDEETFDLYFTETVDLLKKLIKEQPENGDAMAILSSIYGLAITYQPLKGIYYGSKSGRFIEQALEKSPDSPFVNYKYAGYKLYTPSMWGGDVDIAIDYFKKAIETYESDNLTNEWHYLDALMGLSIAYEKQGDQAACTATLERLIGIEPGHRWAQVSLSKKK